nr:alpha/beta hydrolase [Roseomonas rosulenta]
MIAICGGATAEEHRRVAANGTTFTYVEAGQGPPVVLIHGGLQDFRMWRDLLPSFAAHYRVVSYSRRNRFPDPVSAEGTPDGAGDLHAEDLAALLRSLGIERAHVVAHSSGAVAALFFASRYPGMVRSLALNEPPAAGLLAGTPDGQSLLREQGQRLAPARSAFAAGDLNHGVRLFVDAVRGAGAFDRQPEADQRMALDNAASHLADQVSTHPRAPFGCDAASRISAPVLLTGGDRSTPFFAAILDALERCLADSERATVAGAAHNVPGDAPEAYRDAVLAFLARH